MLESKPDDAVDLLETALLTKKTAFAPAAAASGPSTEAVAGAKALAALYAPPVVPVNEETGEPEAVEPPNEYETEDLLAHAALLDAVGCPLPQGEAYAVMLAAKALGESPEHKLKTVRFFGKVLGLSANYYVFEGVLKEKPSEAAATAEGAAPAELNVGTNAYTYFVSTSPGGTVTRLPDVTPEQIVVSGSLKRYLTGDLGAAVSSYPVFPGKEAEYLRAVIARVASDTVLAPAGKFTISEDNDLVEAEDFATPDAAALGEAAGWCHRYPYVLPQGRCEFWAPEPAEPDEGEEPPPPVEPEVGPPLLSSAGEDNLADADEGEEATPAWAPVASSALASVPFKVAGVRSLKWAGAYAVGRGAEFANVYIGDGVENKKFVQPAPPAVEGEYAEELTESTELPPKPETEEAAEGEGEGEAAEGEAAEGEAAE